MNWTPKRLPAARTDGLHVEDLGDETVIYDATNRHAHCLSPLAAVVFATSDGRTTVETMAATASERLAKNIDEEQVLEALSQLEGRQLMAFMPVDGGMSRRDLVRRSAVAAVSAPLIASVITSPAIAAASATCGTAPSSVLCCPCATGSGQNKDECCEIPGITERCQCVNASEPGSGLKFCKPSGQGAPSAAECGGALKPCCAWCIGLTLYDKVGDTPNEGVCQHCLENGQPFAQGTLCRAPGDTGHPSGLTCGAVPTLGTPCTNP